MIVPHYCLAHHLITHSNISTSCLTFINTSLSLGNRCAKLVYLPEHSSYIEHNVLVFQVCSKDRGEQRDNAVLGKVEAGGGALTEVA